MNTRNRLVIGLIFFFLVMGSVSVFVTARLDVNQQYGPLDKEFYLSDTQVAFVRPGLKLEIQSVKIVNLTTVVTFKMTDPRGLPLDISGIVTPGPIDVRFILARIPKGAQQYEAYTTRIRRNAQTGISYLQATNDSGGTFKKIADGTYEYLFGTKLPADFDTTVTHTVGIHASRDLTEFRLGFYVANAAHHFVPDGTAVKVVRDVVRTEACNQCHNPLKAHTLARGGIRREIELCVLCHTPQSTDDVTGNPIDLRVMIHKIHMGEDLPSVKAGTPYQIEDEDFSEVKFPQDIRNCEKCHVPAQSSVATVEGVTSSPAVVGGSQSAAYLLRPSAGACGSCHDDVNFKTGKGHLGGPQASDKLCGTCHIPEGELEFDASIKGAHTIPYRSQQLKGLNIALLDVAGAGPGQNPTVAFKITENDGKALSPADLPFFNLTLAGPTTDYSVRYSESARTASVPLTGVGYTYTFQGKIPAAAKGSFVVGAEAYRMVKLNPGTTKERDHRETVNNPIRYFAVTDSAPVPRRLSVSTEKCNKCHENLALHGTVRHDPEKYCVICHNPSHTDEARRPADQMPAQAVHLKFMIHRIHTGHELTRDFTVYGFGNRAINFNELRFPGDRRDCETCHVNNSYRLPLPQGLLATTAPREFFSPLQPATAACLGCHDTRDAAAHAFTMTTPFGEACAACHGTGREFAVERVHAR